MDLVESPAPFEFVLIPERSIEDAGDFAEGKSPSREGLFSILDKESRAAQILFCKFVEHQTEGRFWFSMLR